MKINRNLAISFAIAALAIAGLVVWQISGNEPMATDQSKAVATASESPTPNTTQEENVNQDKPKSSALPARNIWTYNCEIPVQLPDSFYLTCGDGGWYVHSIKWKTWNENEATATAIFSQKVCEPSCAEGFRVEAPVTLAITTFAKPGKKIYLTNLEMRASGDQNFENGDRTITWDLGEFAKMMDSDN